MSVRSFGKTGKSRLIGNISLKTHKTALVIIPPKEILPPIQKIRKKHDRQYHRWMPHVNLLYPFKPKSEFSKALDLIWLIGEKTEPFKIHLRSFHFFCHTKGMHTLWLTLEPVDRLRTFQNKLQTMFPECDDLNRFHSGFTPHLSIGQIKGRERTKNLKTELEKSWESSSFRLTEIHLIWRKNPPDDRFRIGETVRLGGN